MQPLLEGLNQVPGVVGSLVCAQDGRVLAHAFPPVFDASSLQDAATVLADGAAGLETVTGPIDVVDLRYPQARVIVKPMTSGHVLLLCSSAVNVQTLLITLSVAVKKLEKLAVAPAEEPAPIAAAPAEAAAWAEAAPPAPEDPPSPEAAPEPEPARPSKPKGKTNWWPSV